MLLHTTAVMNKEWNHNVGVCVCVCVCVYACVRVCVRACFRVRMYSRKFVLTVFCSLPRNGLCTPISKNYHIQEYTITVAVVFSHNNNNCCCCCCDGVEW